MHFPHIMVIGYLHLADRNRIDIGMRKAWKLSGHRDTIKKPGQSRKTGTSGIWTVALGLCKQPSTLWHEMMSQKCWTWGLKPLLLEKNWNFTFKKPWELGTLTQDPCFCGICGLKFNLERRDRRRLCTFQAKFCYSQKCCQRQMKVKVVECGKDQ